MSDRPIPLSELPPTGGGQQELRITANYPASDGRMPESIELHWEGWLPATHQIQTTLETLSAVADRRFSAMDG